MAGVTYYVALPFVMGDDGPEPREAMECTSASSAITRAEILSRKTGSIGAVAFSRTGDPASGEFLRRSGATHLWRSADRL